MPKLYVIGYQAAHELSILTQPVEMACEIPDSLVAGPMPPRRVRLLRDSSGNIIRRGGGLEVSTVQVIDARRLQMMAPRLVELRHVLKPTGSIYLHCDPTASHYLKLLMDAVFGLQHFLNEIVWKPTRAHGSTRRFAPVHDTVLWYARSEEYAWYGSRAEPNLDYIAEKFRKVDKTTARRFQGISLTGTGVRTGDRGKPWRGFDPILIGRH